MAKEGKRFKSSSELLDASKRYTTEEAVELLKKMKPAKFDETVEVAVRLGVDPKHADQMVRGTVQLPHGTGKSVRVAVLAKGDKEKEAKDAGADVVGSDDLIKKIQEGWMEFDRLVATPDMMGAVGKLGSILGPRGLMPNPKTGTVTQDVSKAVSSLKAGRIEFRADKAGNLHAVVGKASFEGEKLKDNLKTLMEAVMKAKPSASKGVYVRSVTISTTMGPGIRLNEVQYA